MKLPCTALFFLLLVLFFFDACTARKKVEQPDAQNKTPATLNITSFPGLPADMAGCSCYFSETRANFEKEEYLFASNYEGLAIVSVDSTIIKLKIIATTRQPHTFGDHDYQETYANKAYKAVLKMQYRKANGEETWWNAGTLTLSTPDGKLITKNLVGECGC